ncbi:RUS1 family protein C16orf58-like protein [Hypsibius exemplaris]|uniref:RUS1 family protein C16orf58-like protein n=1 Tax=Hypsibius exemplaris TaxID=2072580 RepID=A0A1W0X3I6_HYPEX|nr:RUS1 family protein C16orf58-like protein [Hypsibius exemplaris]
MAEIVAEECRVFKNGRRKHYGFGNFFNEVFFPEGYPDTVSKDYLGYQIFDTIQAFCSSVNGTIATQSIMQGLGVGEEATTALAATMTWVLKDGVGMIGRIVFAWAQGSDLDCDLKRWRLRADILNDVAMFLDVCSPSFGHYFVYIVCLSALLKAVVGIAGVGTRPAIIQHQARRNNIGDVAAKDSSQETLVNLAALMTSLFLMPLLNRSPWYSWTAFFLLAFIHIFANYCAVRALSMETFNQSRFHLAVNNFFSSGYTFVPSVGTVNSREPVIFSLFRPWKLEIGSRIPKQHLTGDEYQALRSLYDKEVYSLYVNDLGGKIYIFLSQTATQEDVMRAAFEGELVAYRLGARKGYPQLDLMRQARLDLDDLFARFQKLAQAEGWDFSCNYFGVKEWRVTWRNPPISTDHVTIM